MAALETSRQLVVFSLGDEEDGLPITRVQEIIRHAEPRSVASHDPANRGVIVDEVEEVLTLDESSTDPVPGTGADFIEAIAKIGDRLIVLLNPDGIFAGLELAA